MSTDVNATAAVENAAESTENRGRSAAFDWAAANSVEDKSLHAENPKLAEYWEYAKNSQKSDDTPAPKQLVESLFTSKVEYWKWRKDFYAWRMEVKVEAFKASQKSLQSKIEEAESFLNTVATHGEEVAEEVAKMERLRKQFEDSMEKLKNSGYVATSDLEEEEELE